MDKNMFTMEKYFLIDGLWDFAYFILRKAETYQAVVQLTLQRNSFENSLYENRDLK